MEKIILIIDDDPVSLKRAAGIIEKDYRVAAATGGAVAFRYLEKNTPDMILLDLNMPDMNGLEVIEKLRKDPEHAKIPVVFLASAQDAKEEERCLAAGAVDFVNKPFIPQELKDRIKKVLGE